MDIFRWLDEQLVLGQGELTRSALESYFYQGHQVKLIDRQKGIWNPQTFDSTLSVTTSFNSPYKDQVLEGGLIQYKYRRDQEGGDNKKLVKAFENSVPMPYFHAIRPAVYVPYYPVRIIRNEPAERQVVLSLDEILRFFGDPLKMVGDTRRYAERVARERLHQPLFRAKVMHAYNRACAICSLKHVELLDAAHIIGDNQDDGLAIVTNGISLCKIHHASFDRNLLGITPDYEVRIDRDLLDEVDGPMLRHGLQDMHGRKLVLPKRRAEWPARDRLATRFEKFAASVRWRSRISSTG
ncbi:HNH endonuclease [Agromyces cerinus subsp. nitratus]